jgi:hypothetical protein
MLGVSSLVFTYSLYSICVGEIRPTWTLVLDFNLKRFNSTAYIYDNQMPLGSASYYNKSLPLLFVFVDDLVLSKTRAAVSIYYPFITHTQQ